MLALLACFPASRAGEIRFTFANDFLVGNTIKDDLYTFAAAVEFTHEHWDVALWENAFTDSAHDLRFDETYLTASRTIALSEKWLAEIEGGVLHVGEGLLGQSSQNSFHRLIGDNELNLTYIRDEHLHAKARVGLRRHFRVGDRLWITPRIDLDASFGFRRDVTPRASVLWQGERGLAFIGGLGWRLTSVDLEALEPWIAESGPTAEAGLRIHDHWSVLWTYNEYGTEVRHLRINYNWSISDSRAR
ncbi:MAG: lipid A deacylase LpxR family protein, partial [Acidobacteriota bacterium]|nr:lipid A deacylase LpxR family protein [Acidobacteriota bacterium]